MALMCAFSILQKSPKIAKMTPDDLLALKMVSSEPQGNTEHSFSFLKFVIFVGIERKNDFDGNNAIYDPWLSLRVGAALKVFSV